ncbi:MAG: VWA domain-containing protein [Holophagales bacterium]|nr:VWA domain-containing protein [Holophagales bacterium]MYC08875.1 VWA domain-containing protein [Holophagales bacterium]
MYVFMGSVREYRPVPPMRPQTTPGAALLAIAVWTTPEAAVHPQAGSAQGTAGTDSDAASIATLNGTWVRNDELSEDPIDQLTAIVGGRSRITASSLEVAERLSERRRSARIQAESDRILIENARRESIHLPVDGLPRRYTADRTSAAYFGGGVLEVVTSGTDLAWQWIETYYRSGDRLVHVTELRNLTVPDLNFTTVYDHAEARPPPAGPVDAERIRSDEPPAIRIVPPRGSYREFLSGPVGVQALVIDPLIHTVEFLLDGKLVNQARKRPFKARVRLSHPPREETLEVRGYRDGRAHVGTDRIVLNRLHSPFAVQIAALRPLVAGGASAVSVAARVSVPRAAALARVEFYLSDRRLATFEDPDWKEIQREPRTIRVEAPVGDVEPGDFIRVVARLADGREREDAELLQEAEYSGEVDVQLVQLQILAVDRDGEPVGDLQPADFEIHENGERRPVENLHASNDVPLLLGIAIDSSGSMTKVWQRLQTVVRMFMAAALATDDRAFLVDFDDTVRFLQPLTDSKPLLSGRLNRLLVGGGTALNDGLLFSLLHFGREPGRRALVVVTDGNDADSRSKAAQVSDFADWMGVPIYFIAVGWSAPPPILVRKLTRRTGGRLFRIHPGLPRSEVAAEMERVFDRINEDLRHQYVLTYYSKLAQGEAVEPEVRSLRRDVTLRSILPLQGLE